MPVDLSRFEEAKVDVEVRYSKRRFGQGREPEGGGGCWPTTTAASTASTRSAYRKRVGRDCPGSYMMIVQFGARSWQAPVDDGHRQKLNLKRRAAQGSGTTGPEARSCWPAAHRRRAATVEPSLLITVHHFLLLLSSFFFWAAGALSCKLLLDRRVALHLGELIGETVPWNPAIWASASIRSILLSSSLNLAAISRCRLFSVWPPAFSWRFGAVDENLTLLLHLGSLSAIWAICVLWLARMVERFSSWAAICPIQ